MVDLYGCFKDNHTQQADAEQAYIQAELKGNGIRPTYVALPMEAWPDSWKPEARRAAGLPVLRRPVVQLLRALYGHPDSGTLWEKHCDRKLQSVDFCPVENWPSCYWHEKLQLMLCVYVDDFKLSGPRDNLRKGWDIIQGCLLYTSPSPRDLSTSRMPSSA